MELAHEYAMKCIGNPNVSVKTNNEIIAFAWQYADAMQAEANKRKSKPELPSLQQTFIDGVEQPRYAPPCEEWQPDWSQAPDDKITHWTMEKDKRYSWWIGEPKKDSQNHYESIENANCSFYGDAPPFDYQGNWQDSLRKRP